jgi:PAS domain S-box-containing protein
MISRAQTNSTSAIMNEAEARTARMTKMFSRLAGRRAWLLFALLLSGANSLYAFSALRDLSRAHDRVDHTQEMLIRLGRLLSRIQDAESASRSYILTGRELHLEHFKQADLAMPSAVSDVHALTSENATQHGRLVALNPTIAARFDLLRRGIARRQTDSGVDQATLEAGDRMTGVIRAAIGGMEAEERRLYAQRAEAARWQASLARHLLVLGTMLSLMIIAAVFALARREERRRKAAEAGLRTVNAELERRVEERTLVLGEKEQFLATVIDNMHDAILVHRDDAILLANRRCLQLLGARGPEQVVGQSPLSFYPPDLREGVAERVRQVFTETGSVPLVEQRLVRVDGKTVDVETNSIAFIDRGQRTALSILRDITHRKAAEAQLRQAQKMEAVGQLTGGVAHDFNNLLTVIVANLDILGDTVNEDPELRAVLNAALGGAMRGAELTRRLLAFARKQPLEPQVIDLNERLPALSTMLTRTLGEQIRVEVKLAAGLWRTRADPSQVEDALLNLAINARDAMPAGGALTIESSNAQLDATYTALNPEVVPGDYVQLTVTDTGVGMTPEVIERALEPFFTTKEQGQGTGLGLSMIYGFAKQSGGHLKIYSEVGVGTTVNLYLPRASSAELPTNAPTAGAAPIPVGHESILLVEDNPDVRAAAVRQLIDLGYRVRVAANGPSALAVLDSGEVFDLLFTDIVMPERMSGYDLAHAAGQRQPGIKILFTTGYSEAPTVSGAKPAKDALMLRKPYRKRELAETVRAALDRLT